MYQYKVTGYSEKDNIFTVQPLVATSKNKMTPEELITYVKNGVVTNIVLHEGRMYKVPCVIDALNDLNKGLGNSDVVYYMINPRIVDGVPCRAMRFFNSKGADITKLMYDFVGVRLDYYYSKDLQTMLAKNTKDYHIKQLMSKFEKLGYSCAFHCGLLSSIRSIKWTQINWNDNK